MVLYRPHFPEFSGAGFDNLPGTGADHLRAGLLHAQLVGLPLAGDKRGGAGGDHKPLLGDNIHYRFSGVDHHGVAVRRRRQTFPVFPEIGDLAGPSVNAQAPLAHGPDHVLGGHLPVAFVELDPLFEVEGPGEKVIGNAPGFGQVADVVTVKSLP